MTRKKKGVMGKNYNLEKRERFDNLKRTERAMCKRGKI